MTQRTISAHWVRNQDARKQRSNNVSPTQTSATGSGSHQTSERPTDPTMTDQELGEAIINQARHVANLTAAYETAKAARREFDRAVSDAAEQRQTAYTKLNDLIDQAGSYGLKATP